MKKEPPSQHRYDFKWEILDVIIGGKSMLDQTLGLSGFPMLTHEDADRFMRSYGYDLDDPIETAEVLGNFHEAINFIRKKFLQPDNPDGPKIEIPRKILEMTDVRELLLMAAGNFPGQTTDSEGTFLRDWGCALLKVVHTIAHLDKDVRYSYFKEIQQQIFDRFYKAVHRTDNKLLYLGESPEDPLRIELAAFETKPKKTRDSLLLKLLHKPESVADEIFDRVGLRFVTKNRVDALRVVKYLKDAMILVPVNIKASRSRNSLMDLEEVKAILSRDSLDEEQVAADIEKLDRPLTSWDSQNPHSSDRYHAIQFTSRQLIKLKNPVYENIKELKSLNKKNQKDGEQAAESDYFKVVDGIDMQYMNREIRFFYPYEVQIVDQASHEENEKGRSAHSEYKKSQAITAMKRVMGNLLNRSAGGIA